jgi:hypothetical protein
LAADLELDSTLAEVDERFNGFVVEQYHGRVHGETGIGPRARWEAKLRPILAHKWQEVDLTFSPDDHTDFEALVATVRITGGNFRLVQRLFSQIEQVLAINRLQNISAEVVDTARKGLVIGP